MEILSPAGNMEKLRAAILYGADAVYLAGTMFGMRAAADNFTDEELQEAVAYAHERNVKLYVTVNVMPRTQEYGALEKYLVFLEAIGVDAVIIGDIGVLRLCRRVAPRLPIHISTQANTVSLEACLAFYDLGARRIVLARELTLNEIREIKKGIPKDLELEAFVHGSMCISYSGRCLLSGHFTGRDANRGACTQPCRWNYRLSCEIVEEKRPEMPLPLIEENGETFIMSSKDMCMIAHIKELYEAGLDSLKIEGRMKSAYYTAVVTNTYRMACDAYEKAPDGYTVLPEWERELSSVSHREYDTGYYFTDCHADRKTTQSAGYLREKAYLGTVLSYDSRTKTALCRQKNKLTLGEAAELLSPGEIGKPFTVKGLSDEEATPIPSAPHPEMLFRLEMPFPVKPGDILRGV